MSVPSPAELLAFLLEHGFLTPRQVQQLGGGSDTEFADGRALARVLLERNWLTAYQANQLLQGRGEDLLLGPYRLMDRLGEGGMGQVFKAHHVRMDRIVALKIIPKDRVSNPVALGRFYREARAVAKLSHPNIVVAFEVNQVGETPFLAMEYVEGIDLARLVQQSGPLPIPNACEYIRQAAVGLQHAHEKGLVHRDIKPGNLMVARLSPDEPPVIKILDFGLARFECESTQSLRLTQLGKIVGTVDFIAPEQADNSRTADIRADIYSLGCSLFYLLTGNPPFPGEHPVEKIAARMLGDAPSVRASRPEVSPALERVLAKMMTRDPADRYQTPGEVVKALGPHAAKERQARSMPTSIAARPVAQLAQPQTDAPSAPAVRPEPSRFSVSPPAPPLGFPDTVAESYEPPPISWQEPGGRKRKPLAWLLAGVVGAVVLLGVLVGVIVPAGKRSASDSKKEQLLIPGDTHVDEKDRTIPGEKTPQPKVRLDKEGKVRTLSGHSGCVFGVVFLPDGRRVLSGAADKTVRLWDLEAGKELRRFIGHTDWVTSVALAPDGTRFASASGDRSVRIWDINSDRPLQVLPDHPGPLTCVAFSPDGHRLLSVGGFDEALIWNLEDGKIVKRINLRNGCHRAAFGPGGGETFAVTPGRLVWLFTGNDPKPRVFEGHTGDVRGLAISHSGTLIASSSFDGVRLWDVAQAKEVRCFKEHTGVVNSVAFSPDGRRIVSAGSGADRVLRLWETDTGQELRRMEGHGGNIPCVAISPDGRYALSGGEDSNLILWKLPE